MDFLTKLAFNPKSPTLMHIDLNSCFATIEQQANRKLRGRPIAVAAYKTPNGCILAPSVEAKRFGVKVGMRVKDGKILCPDLIILEPDPWKYRNVHIELRKVLSKYTEKITPKSIDEFVLDVEGFPALNTGMYALGTEIKHRIKSEIGEWLTVSIGIGPNRFLAKTAAGLKKPDGLEIIDNTNYAKIYSGLQLRDFNGIKTNNIIRLNKQNIFTVEDFYNAEPRHLYQAFHSIVGYYWYLRLKGWEIDDVIFGRHSYGNSTSLYKPLTTCEELAPILMKLVEKMARRMRQAGYLASGVHVAIYYKTGAHWHHGVSVKDKLFASGDIYRVAYKILTKSPYKHPVHNIAVSCFNLTKESYAQLNIFDDIDKKKRYTQALDTIADKWGDYVITPALMVNTRDMVKDKIAFGNVKELEEFMFRN